MQQNYLDDLFYELRDLLFFFYGSLNNLFKVMASFMQIFTLLC